MKFHRILAAVHAISISSSLLFILALAVSSCAWYPDFTNPSPHRQLEDPLAGTIVKSIPFSITRTAQIGTSDIRLDVQFAWEQKGRLVWEGLGFFKKATEWRFVLFGPDRKTIICQLDWLEAVPVQTQTCSITKAQSAVPLNAYINFQFSEDEKEDKEVNEDKEKCPDGKRCTFRTVGRPFYFVAPADYFVAPKK